MAGPHRPFDLRILPASKVFVKLKPTGPPTMLLMVMPCGGNADGLCKAYRAQIVILSCRTLTLLTLFVRQVTNADLLA